MSVRDHKIDFEKRFHDKWTSFSIAYHFKSIIAHLLEIEFNEVNLHLSQEFPTELEAAYAEIQDRLEQNEPLQYIIGETEFRNVKILCTPAALIPRPETEELVDLVLEVIKDEQNPKILDLCTGTGCIAISLADELSNGNVSGLDVYTEVITLAKKNSALNNTKVSFSVVDVLSEKQMQKFETEDYDVWVSNPPYIPIEEKANMDQNVTEFEPEEALFVPNEDPLLFYRQIALSAKRGLRKNGHLFYEIHEEFSQETIDLLDALNFKNINAHSDLQGKIRMISAQKV